MKPTLIIFMLLLANGVYGQETFNFPAKLSTLPVTYLEKLQVKDVNRKLSEQERHGICRLFIKAHLVTQKKYQQDYLLNINAPVYRLFKANFPDVTKREGEGGIFLGDIFSFIKSLPTHKSDIEKVSAEVSRKKRKND